MFSASKNEFRIAAGYQSLIRRVGLDAETVFDHPEILVWRKLPDRENCTLDALWEDGRKVRLHIKRYQPAYGFTTPADDEVKGHAALTAEQIPTAPLVGWGKLVDRRSFVIFEDLSGYLPADKAIDAGIDFQHLLEPTAYLAAKLHSSGLHHRDLYLCHFMASIDPERMDLKLIDTARVRRLPGILTRGRWIIKDLAQFWYSTTKHPITDAQRRHWLERYAQARGLKSVDSLQRSIERKARSIARHDKSLRHSQPTRNISISH